MECPAPLCGPETWSRSSGARAAGGEGADARPARGRAGPRGQARPARHQTTPGRRREAGRPFGTCLPSWAVAQNPKVGGGRAQLGAPAEPPCLFPRRLGLPPRGTSSRPRRRERKGALCTHQGRERPRGSPFSKGSSSAAEWRGKAFVREKGFLCVHGSFQKPLFPLPVASHSALPVPPNLLLSRVRSSELARGASQANPAPGPQLRGP